MEGEDRKSFLACWNNILLEVWYVRHGARFEDQRQYAPLSTKTMGWNYQTVLLSHDFPKVACDCSTSAMQPCT